MAPWQVSPAVAAMPRFKNVPNQLPHVATSSIWLKTFCLIATNTSNPAAYPLLDELAQALQQTKVEHIEIAGHRQQRQRRLQSAPIPSTRSSRFTSLTTTPQCQPSHSPRLWRSTTCRTEWSRWRRQPKQPSAQSTCRNIDQNPVIELFFTAWLTASCLLTHPKRPVNVYRPLSFMMRNIWVVISFYSRQHPPHANLLFTTSNTFCIKRLNKHILRYVNTW